LIIAKDKQHLISLIETHPLHLIDVSNIFDLSNLFKYKKVSGDISKWNVRNAVNLSDMFAYSIFSDNHDNLLSLWNVENAIDLSGMFRHSNFNGYINKWNISNALDVSDMFAYTDYNKPLNEWNISNVLDASDMFAHTNYNKPLNNWNFRKDCIFEDFFAGNKNNLPLKVKVYLSANRKKRKESIHDEIYTYPALTSNKYTYIIKYKIDNMVAVRKNYTYNGYKSTLSIPQKVLMQINSINALPKFIKEDDLYYYFEYIEGIPCTEEESYNIVKEIIKKYPNIEDIFSKLDVNSLNYIKSHKENRIMDIKFILNKYLIKEKI
jgi:hypothetical protein